MSVDRFAAGIVTGIGASVVSAILFGFAFEGLNSPLALCSLLAGLLAAIWCFQASLETTPLHATAWDALLLGIFALASLRAFLWLIYPSGDEWRILSPYNLGDISLHIQFIRYFAGGINFWPASPILTGVPLTYPPGADLWNSLLLLAGLPLERGLVWTGLGGAALTAWALWRWGGAFAVAALLFNGGLAGFQILQTGQLQDFQSELAWKNFFLTMFVTQRGLLYALPCGLLLLRAWRDDFFREGSGLPRGAQFFLYATMPFFSVHTFLFLSLALAAIFLFTVRQRPALLLLVAMAIVPATTAIWLVTGGFSAASGVRWLPGWMQGEEGWKFWAMNFGVGLPLLLWLFGETFLRGDRESRAFGVVSLAVFLLCFFISFAPWEWDNTKLLLWAWLVAAPFLWSRILAPLAPVLRSALCVALFFSGAVSLIAGLDGRHGYGLASRSELAATQKILRDIPPETRLAVEPQFNHPAILLGYPVVCGYDGHLWSHGLAYQETYARLKSVMRKESGWIDRAGKLGARWIYFRGPTPALQEVEGIK